MSIRYLPFVAVVFLAPVALQGQEKEKGENPFRSAKVGDYITYKMTTSIMGKDIEGTMKQTISAKSETEATMKTAASVFGIAVPEQESKIDLTKPYDAASAAVQKNAKGKFEKTGEGKEKVTIGDKTYDCTWLTGKVMAQSKGLKINSDVKIWFAKSVPLTGMVKLEMKANIADIRMELTESGSAKSSN